jgi:hypothetical protein
MIDISENNSNKIKENKFENSQNSELNKRLETVESNNSKEGNNPETITNIENDSETNSIKNESFRPSAEDLIDLERELHRLIAKKQNTDANLIRIESRIYDFETEYLNETSIFGNLVHGLEGYLGFPTLNQSNSQSILTSTANPSSNSNTSSYSGRKGSSTGIPNSKRLFSNSSTTYGRSLALIGRLSEAKAADYVPDEYFERSNRLSSLGNIKNSLISSSSNNRPATNLKHQISPITNKKVTTTDFKKKINKSRK